MSPEQNCLFFQDRPLVSRLTYDLLVINTPVRHLTGFLTVDANKSKLRIGRVLVRQVDGVRQIDTD